MEACANLLMFIPLGLFVAIALPQKTWWQLAAVGALTSVAMELGQLLFIPARFSSLSDVVTNTVGAVIGIASASLLTRSIAAAPANA
ncbi:VanZ family protein [Arthrobacter sp. ISL-95]|uniref:VanZ family protein n=1 Tax=Arthrobacter sp. ISL-95 TaxID=2819116 RepID=UPI002852E26C|nr:VanZ family protein [Arthrobacter sp. ISL-95]